MPAPTHYAASSDLSFDVLLPLIRPGDKVSYTDRFSQVKKGKVMIVPSHGDIQHVVLDVGGKHGTPQVVDARNFHTFSPAKERREAVMAAMEEINGRNKLDWRKQERDQRVGLMRLNKP